MIHDWVGQKAVQSTEQIGFPLETPSSIVQDRIDHFVAYLANTYPSWMWSFLSAIYIINRYRVDLSRRKHGVWSEQKKGSKSINLFINIMIKLNQKTRVDFSDLYI